MNWVLGFVLRYLSAGLRPLELPSLLLAGFLVTFLSTLASSALSFSSCHIAPLLAFPHRFVCRLIPSLFPTIYSYFSLLSSSLLFSSLLLSSLLFFRALPRAFRNELGCITLQFSSHFACKFLWTRQGNCHDTALELASGVNFGCVLHHFSSLTRLTGSSGQL